MIEPMNGYCTIHLLRKGIIFKQGLLLPDECKDEFNFLPLYKNEARIS